MLPGILCGMHFFIYGQMVQVFSLSRAGYIPPILSRTIPTNTPWISLLIGRYSFIIVQIIVLQTCITGSVLGFVATVIVAYTPKSVQGALFAIALFATLCNYMVQMVSFVILRY